MIRVSERAVLVRADNPGPMTLDGTNTWVLREPGAAGVVVVDPGPLDDTHLSAVLEEARRDGGRVELVLYSHWHPDHTDSIDRFAELTGAPARALDPAWCREATPVQDGEGIEVDGLALRILATPGHTSDSISVLLPTEGSLLTADTVLGRGTTVIAHPDGVLAAYLDSLRRLRELVLGGSVLRMLPGHGPVREDPQTVLAVLDGYLAHREARLREIRAALEAGCETAGEIVDRVYTGLSAELRSAAESSVRAQLAYLSGDSGS